MVIPPAFHNIADFIDLAGFVFVIAEHRDESDALRRITDVFHQQARFVRKAVVDDVAA